MEFLLDRPLLLCAAVFFARVTDVTLGTLRTILVFRAYRARAALIGFIEVLIWLGAASLVLQNLSTWPIAVAYAGGFAAGNFVGISLETKLAMGQELVRVISANRAVELAAKLRARSFSVTELVGRDDAGGPVEVLLVVEERRRLPELLRLVEETDSEAVYTLSDIKRHWSAAHRDVRKRRMFRLRK
ncbi:MAG: DUF5698 domain-containing protein [Planctomycetota bacterium]